MRLGLATDRFNPFSNMSYAYNMWQIFLIPYNLLSWKCMKEESFMLTLLIPSPTTPNKDMDAFLRPLLDEYFG